MRITESGLRRIIREAIKRSLYEDRDFDAPETNPMNQIRYRRERQPGRGTAAPRDAADLRTLRAQRDQEQRLMQPQKAEPGPQNQTQNEAYLKQALAVFSDEVFNAVDNFVFNNSVPIDMPPQFKRYISDLYSKVSKDPRIEKPETEKALKDAVWLRGDADSVEEIYKSLVETQQPWADSIRKLATVLAILPKVPGMKDWINKIKTRLDPEKRIKDWDAIIEGLNQFDQWSSSSGINWDSVVSREGESAYISPQKIQRINWRWLRDMGVDADELFMTMSDKIEDADIAKRMDTSLSRRNLDGGVTIGDALWSLSSAKTRLKQRA